MLFRGHLHFLAFGDPKPLTTFYLSSAEFKRCKTSSIRPSGAGLGMVVLHGYTFPKTLSEAARGICPYTSRDGQGILGVSSNSLE